MIIEQIMNKDIITLTENSTIHTAINLIKEKRIRHIPIVNEKFQLVGLVSDRDIRDATPSIFHFEESKEDLQKPISTVMKTEIITGHPLDFVEEVGVILCENNISCLPIIQDKKLVGIITGTDLLQSYIELTGVNHPGSQIEVKVPNRTGILHDILTVFKKRNANIQSVLVYPDKNEDSYKIIVVRVQTMNPFKLADDLRNEGYTVIWPSLSVIES